MMTFLDLLPDIRKKACSEHEKGFRVETLMRACLLPDPMYAAPFAVTIPVKKGVLH